MPKKDTRHDAQLTINGVTFKVSEITCVTLERNDKCIQLWTEAKKPEAKGIGFHATPPGQ